MKEIGARGRSVGELEQEILRVDQPAIEPQELEKIVSGFTAYVFPSCTLHSQPGAKDALTSWKRKRLIVEFQGCHQRADYLGVP